MRSYLLVSFYLVTIQLFGFSKSELKYLEEKGAKKKDSFVLINLQKGDCLKCRSILGFLISDTVAYATVFVKIPDLSAAEVQQFTIENNIKGSNITPLDYDSLPSLSAGSSLIAIYTDFRLVQEELLAGYHSMKFLQEDISFYLPKVIHPQTVFKSQSPLKIRISKIFRVGLDSFVFVSSKDSIYSYFSNSVLNVTDRIRPSGNVQIDAILLIGGKYVCVFSTIQGKKFLRSEDLKIDKEITISSSEDYYPDPSSFCTFDSLVHMAVGTDNPKTKVFFLATLFTGSGQARVESDLINFNCLEDKQAGNSPLILNNDRTFVATKLGRLGFDVRNNLEFELFSQPNLLFEKTPTIRHIIEGVAKLKDHYLVLYRIGTHLFVKNISMRNPLSSHVYRIAIKKPLGQTKVVAERNGFRILNITTGSTDIFELTYENLSIM